MPYGVVEDARKVVDELDDQIVQAKKALGKMLKARSKVKNNEFAQYLCAGLPWRESNRWRFNPFDG